MALTVIQASNLVCGYHAANPLTIPLNLTVEQGDIIAVLGINGRGKSTLLHTLLGIQKPLVGKLDCDYSLGFVPQHFTSTFDYSVLEIVLMGRVKQLGLFGKPSHKDIDLAKKNLQRLGLKLDIYQPFSQLSGGQKQLVLIARALTAECQILLLDEPTSGLDLHNQKRVLHILSSLITERGLTIVFSTHDPAQAMSIANKVLLLQEDGYQFGLATSLLTEQHLSQLYQITMKNITLTTGHNQISTIVPLYVDDKE